METGATVVDRGHGIADGEADLFANGRNAVEVGDEWVATAAVELIGALNNAIHVFHGEGNAGHAVVFENGQADDHVALAGEDFGELHIDGGAEGHAIFFVSRDIGAEAADTAGVGIDREAASLKIAGVAIPDDDVARLDPGPLQALGNGECEHRVGRDAFAAEAICFEPDDFVRSALGKNVLPGVGRLIATGVGGDGAIEQIEHTLLIELPGRSVESGVAGDDYPGFAGFNAVGVLVLMAGIGGLGGDVGQAQLALCTQQYGTGQCGFEKFAAVFHGNPRFHVSQARGPGDSELGFYAMRQDEQGLRRGGRGFIGNDANQIRTLAEDDALCKSNAGIAERSHLGVIGAAGIEDLLGSAGCAHRVNVYYGFQGALVFVIRGGGGDDACGDVLLRIAIDVLVEVLGIIDARFAGFFPTGDSAGCGKRVNGLFLAACKRGNGDDSDQNSRSRHMFGTKNHFAASSICG